MAKDGKLTGPEKAAILLMNVGQDLASEVFKFMTPAELQVIGGTMGRKDSVPFETGRQVMKEFAEDYRNGEVVVEGVEFAKNAIVKALGPERAQAILEQITRETGGGSIESLRWMDPAVLANIIKNEHPQIIALILTHLSPDRAASVLLNMPEERVRGEVMLRVATLKRIPQAAVKDLELMLSEQMIRQSATQGSIVEGVKVAAEILNAIETKAEEVIMETIEKSSPDLAQKIQDKMFLFTDLVEVDDKGMQQVIKELTTDMLKVALKGADDALKNKFMKNMSERAAEMLKEDIEAMGPVKLSDVERMQQEIIKVARRLEQEGKVVRAGRGGDVFV